MKRYRYHSKGGHLEVQLDLYSPRKLLGKVRGKLKQRRAKRHKLFVFKIEKRER